MHSMLNSFDKLGPLRVQRSKTSSLFLFKNPVPQKAWFKNPVPAENTIKNPVAQKPSRSKTQSLKSPKFRRAKSQKPSPSIGTVQKPSPSRLLLAQKPSRSKTQSQRDWVFEPCQSRDWVFGKYSLTYTVLYVRKNSDHRCNWACHQNLRGLMSFVACM